MSSEANTCGTPQPASDKYVPDPPRENREWNRIECTCGGMLGMVHGSLLRLRHWDRGHAPGKAAYIYIDLSGEYPEVVAETPARSGAGKELRHGR